MAAGERAQTRRGRCAGKKPYGTREQAEKDRRGLIAHGVWEDGITVYRCGGAAGCGLFHVGKIRNTRRGERQATKQRRR